LDFALHLLSITPEHSEATVLVDDLAHAVLPGHGHATVAHVEGFRWLELPRAIVLEERSAAALTIGAESIWTAEAAALRIKPFGDLAFGEATLRATEPTGAAEVAKAASEVAKATLATGIVEELAHIEAALHVRVKEVAGALLHAAPHAATGTVTGAALTKVTTRELTIGTATETTGRIKVGVKEVAERVATRATGATLTKVTTRELTIGATAEATGATEAKVLLRLKEVALQATALVELKDRALPAATGRIATGTTKRVATGTATEVTTKVTTEVTAKVTAKVTAGCTKAATERVTTGSTKAATGATHHLEEVVTSSTCV
jgi:hypothetical protein